MVGRMEREEKSLLNTVRRWQGLAGVGLFEGLRWKSFMDTIRPGSIRTELPTNLLISCQWADKVGQARTFGGPILEPQRSSVDKNPPVVGSQYRELCRCRQGSSVKIQPSHQPPLTQSDTKIAKHNPLLQKGDGTEQPPRPRFPKSYVFQDLCFKNQISTWKINQSIGTAVKQIQQSLAPSRNYHKCQIKETQQAARVAGFFLS